MKELGYFESRTGIAAALLASWVVACGGEPTAPGSLDESPETQNAEATAESAPADSGQFAVGTVRIEVNGHDGRRLPVQVWYPASDEARAEAEAGRPAYEVEPEGRSRDKLKRVITDGKPGCVNFTMHAAIGAPLNPSLQKLPLLISSHHMYGTRMSNFTINERLASHGFVVAAPDHIGTTLLDLSGDVSRLNILGLLDDASAKVFKTRAVDVSDVIGTLLQSATGGLPEGLAGRIDADRVGIFGHSMGAITVGIAAVNDTRVKAAAYLAMPPTSSTLALVMQTPPVSRYRVPGFYLLAQEDKNAPAVGGANAIRTDFERQRPPAWLAEVADLGHFSIADDLTTLGAMGGCGQEKRLSSSARYTNVAAPVARDIAAYYVTAFFDAQFQGGDPALLDVKRTPDVVVLRKHR